MRKQLFVIIYFLVLSFPVLAENYYEDALRAFENNDIETSYINLKNALQQNDENLPAKILMGHVLLRKGLYQDAIEEFRDAIQLNADPNPFIYEMGRALLFTKQFDEVLSLSDTIALNKENKIKMLLLSSNALSAKNKKNEAKNALFQAEQLEPNRLATITSIGSFELEQRNFEQARRYINKALAIAPKNNRIWHMNGEYYNAQGNGLEALKSFQKAYEIDPKDPVVIRSLANQYATLGQIDEALLFTNKILTETPFDTYTELLKSRLLIKNGQEEQAEEILEGISTRLSLLSDAQKNSDPSIIFVSGSAAFLQGNYEQAQQDLVNYISIVPEDLSGINMLVEIYEAQRQPDKVEALLERFEPRIKKDLYLALNLYSIYLKNNKTYKAKSLLNELERLYSNNILIITAQANYLVKTNRLDEAIQLLNQYAPKEFNGNYELNLAQLYLSVPDFEQATSIADKLLTYKPNASQYILFKGVLLSKQQQWESSLEYFNKVLTIDREHFSAQFNKATALAALGRIEESSSIITPLLEKYPNQHGLVIFSAKLYRDKGDTSKAIEMVKGVLLRKPRDLAAAELLFELYFSTKQYKLALNEAERLTSNTFLTSKYIKYKASALIQLNRFEEANIQLGKLLGLAETSSDFYQLSQLQAQANYVEDAIKSISTAIKKSPKERVYSIHKARLLLTQGENSTAKDILDRLSRISVQDANLQYTYGLYYAQTKSYNMAYNAFNKAFVIDSNFVGAFFKLYSLAQQGIKTSDFIRNSEKELAERPNNHFIRNLLADVYLSKGNQDKALSHYLAIEGKPVVNESSVLNNIANIYLEKDIDKALSYAERAYIMQGNSAAVIDTYGWALSLKGDYNLALQKLRQASAINAKDPLIRYHLGFTLHKMGRLDDAKSELNKAINVEQDYPEKQAAKELLKDIK